VDRTPRRMLQNQRDFLIFFRKDHLQMVFNLKCSGHGHGQNCEHLPHYLARNDKKVILRKSSQTLKLHRAVLDVEVGGLKGFKRRTAATTKIVAGR